MERSFKVTLNVTVSKQYNVTSSIPQDSNIYRPIFCTTFS